MARRRITYETRVIPHRGAPATGTHFTLRDVERHLAIWARRASYAFVRCFGRGHIELTLDRGWREELREWAADSGSPYARIQGEDHVYLS